MSIREDPNARARELAFQLGLRAVHDDEVRPQRKDPLGIGVQQRADARKRFGLRRKVIVGADADDLRPGAD